MMVGENIRRLRIEKGLSQKELAERAELAPSMICMIERGSKSPTVATVSEITKVLGCRIDDVLKKEG